MSLPAFLAVDSTTCDISRRVPSSTDDLGAPVYTWSVIASGVQCAIDPIVSASSRVIRSAVDVVPQGEAETSEFKLLCGPTVDIQAGDIVTDAEDVEYQVDAVAKFSSHKEARLLL
jgi:hypothetical protein